MEETLEPVESAKDEERAWRRKFVLVSVVVVLILVILFAGVGYSGWLEVKELRAELRKVDARSAAQGSAVEAQATANKALRDALESGLRSARSDLTRLAGAVDTLNLRVTEAEQAQPQALVMAEVAYLLELADNRLSLERDRSGALLALDRALNRLDDIKSPAYVPLTEAIVAERAELEAIDSVEPAAVVSRISGLIARVDGIDISTEKLTPDPQAPVNDVDVVKDIKAVMSSVVNNLSQFVKVERAASAKPPKLIPDQLYYARENVRLSLMHARSAALRGDAENMKLGLEEVRHWLAQFPQQGTVAAMDQAVARLLEVDIEVSYPSLSGSLAIARQLTAQPRSAVPAAQPDSSPEVPGETSEEVE